MKISIKEKEKKFEPLELTITIESEEELETLWHRFNIASSNVLEHTSKFKEGKKNVALVFFKLFEHIDELVKKKGLRS